MKSFDTPHSTLHAPRASRAFTLIELLVVMVVMVVILTISLPAFINMGRGMSLRTAVNNVQSTLALSRQWAITHREEVRFICLVATNDQAYYYVIGAMGNVIQAMTDLPLDITLAASSETNLIFKTDGGLTTGAVPPYKYVVLKDKHPPYVTMTISISGLTGGIRVQ